MPDKVINIQKVIPQPNANVEGIKLVIKQWKDELGNLKRRVEIVYANADDTSSAWWETGATAPHAMNAAAVTKVDNLLTDVLALGATQMGF